MGIFIAGIIYLAAIALYNNYKAEQRRKAEQKRAERIAELEAYTKELSEAIQELEKQKSELEKLQARQAVK